MIMIFGNFGFATNKLDGQTIKTRSIYELVKDVSQEGECKSFDTSILKNKMYLFLSFFYYVAKSKKIFYIPAANNLRFFFPVLFLFCYLFNTKICYFVVGGWLSDFLKDRKLLVFLLKKIEMIYCETNINKSELASIYDFKNLEYFPNFRKTNFVPLAKCIKSDIKLKFVYMGRINKMKGIGFMINGLNDIYAGDFDLTIYGQIDGDYLAEFEELVSLNSSFTSYNGSLNPNDIYRVLSEYDILLFPTMYYTEGLPGSVVDAYLSGLPVVASRWKHSGEFVKEGVTGYIYDFNDLTAFKKIILNIVNKPTVLNDLFNNAFCFGKDFEYDNIINKMKEIVG